MRKNYNYTRRKLYLPEYGRHIQEMIDSLLEIEDRRERNRQARAVIAVMGNLNPLLRDTADFTHYGKYVERMIGSLAAEPNPRAVASAVDNLARYMRAKSYEYNQEHPNNEVIVKDIKRMSAGAIEIDEVALNNLRSDYKQPFSARSPKSAPQNRAGHAQGRAQKNRAQQHHRGFAKNNAPHRNSQK